MSSYFLNFKKLVFIFSAILLVSTFSCSDDETCQGEVDNVPTNFPIEGLWIGSYTFDNFPSLGSGIKQVN